MVMYAVVQRMKDLGVDVILGERLDLSSVPTSALNTTEEHVLRTLSGREIRASLVASVSYLRRRYHALHLSSCYARVKNPTPTCSATYFLIP